jgi:hypothetical protein
MAKEWIALTHKSANGVFQMADKEASKIIVKGNFPTGMFMKKGWIGHTLTFEFKDGRLRYTYFNFNYYSPGSAR